MDLLGKYESDGETSKLSGEMKVIEWDSAFKLY